MAFFFAKDSILHKEQNICCMGKVKKVEKQIELEFQINTSPRILFQRLSTPHGLSEWFASNVNLSGNIFTFIWDDDVKKAVMVEKKENKYVRFRWLNGHSENQTEKHFAFKLDRDELTGDISLKVMEDVGDDDNLDEVISLWNYQIKELKRLIGA